MLDAQPKIYLSNVRHKVRQKINKMLLIKRNMSCVASVLRYAEYGEPGKVLKFCMENIEAPESNKVLVKILLAPINPADINTIQGKDEVCHSI